MDGRGKPEGPLFIDLDPTLIEAGSEKEGAAPMSQKGARAAAGKCRAEAEIVLRADSAGATHDLLDWARDGGIRFSVGLDLTEPVREAIARIPHGRWTSALNQDGSARENGEVCEPPT